MGTDALNDRRAGIDAVLTNLSLGIAPDQELIGDQLLPPLPQLLSTVKIPVWGNEAWRIREDKIGDFSEPDKLDVSVGTTSIEVDGHALMAPVSFRHEIESQRGPLRVDLRNQVLQTIVANMRLSREKLQADLLRSTAIYSASHKKNLNTLGTRWDDSANDPLDTLIPMMESIIPDDSGKRATVWWMGQQVWAGLMTNQKIKDRLFGTTGPQGIPTTAALASLLGIGKVLVGRAISKTAVGTNTKLWGKDSGLLFVPPTAGDRIPAFGYTVEQKVFGNATESIAPPIPDPKMGAAGGEWIKRSSFYTPASTFPDAGALFSDAVL